MSNAQEQLLDLQRLVQLLPQVNRDTLFVLLNFLALVAANSEDRIAPDGKFNSNFDREDIVMTMLRPLIAGTTETGNKMDATNLATLFAPNILHTFQDEPALPTSSSAAAKSSGFAPAAIINAIPSKQTPERMEYVSAIRSLIEKREQIFELPVEEVHDLYLFLLDNYPDVLDGLLRRRCALAGQE